MGSFGYPSSSTSFGYSSSPSSSPSFGYPSSSTSFGYSSSPSSSPSFGCSSPSFGCSSSTPSFFSSFGQRTPTTTTQAPASFSFSVFSTTTPSSLPQQQTQASVQINAEKDTNQELSKPDDQEQSKAKIPSIQQNKTVDNFQSVKQEKASETNGSDVVTDHFKESGSDSLNVGFKLSLGELSDGEEIVDAKDESICLATEGNKKSERFENTRILRGITQTPHHTPLQCYSKRTRDKLIVAWDEIFEDTIDQIQRLTTENFSSNVRELWKTMAELKNMGYNVARLENRMEDLTDVINRRKTSQTEITDLRAKAEDYKEQKKKIEKEIADLQAQADNAQVMVNELMDQVDKMEGNLPVFDALFEGLAVNPL